ncbi:MAG: hypothetical protein HC912_00660 [Saprospiraceae bacterium]|nr:hypothetical protein [Saprospiraceae bacterium]
MMIDERYENLVIKADFDALRANRMKAISQEAVLEFSNVQEKTSSWQVTIEPRGNFRRSVCVDMPPIRIIFSKETLHEKGFAENYRKYRLVTHCLDKPESEQTLMKEYWAYKLYNQITTQSFRVHLMKVTYLNTADNTATTRFAFLVEDNDELEDRLNGKMKDLWGLDKDALQATSYQNMVFFQYMIGNADWSIPEYRNLRFIYPKGSDKAIVVPYDFDCSGLVNAFYARPNTNAGQQQVAQRVVMGKNARGKSSIKPSKKFRYLTSKPWSFEDAAYLKASTKQEMKNYLADFVNVLRSDKKLQRLFAEQ